MLKVLNDKCVPERGTEHSACIDLKASEDVTIRCGETKVVGLGVCISRASIDEALRESGMYEGLGTMIEMSKCFSDFMATHFLQLQLRSSLGKKGLILPNGIGVIDLDFEDEIMMIIHNPIKTDCLVENDDDPLCQIELDDGIFHIKEGDRIAQVMVQEHKTDLLGTKTDKKRTGGFGSTGK